MSLACLICASASAQNIYTVVDFTVTARAVDGQEALNAPLNGVYGLLFDNHWAPAVSRRRVGGTTGAERYAGRSPACDQDGSIADGTPASGLDIEALRGMVEDATGNLYLGDAAQGHVYRVALDGTVTTFAGGGTNGPGSASDGGPRHCGAPHFAA